VTSLTVSACHTFSGVEAMKVTYTVFGLNEGLIAASVPRQTASYCTQAPIYWFFAPPGTP